MADKFTPMTDTESEEPYIPGVSAKWWSDLGDGLQAEVQQGVWPGVANFVIFDTLANNRVKKNDVVTIAGDEATEEEIALWETKAQDYLDSL